MKDKNKKEKKTSWGKVADWYDRSVKSEDSFQKTLILPNTIRLLGDLRGKKLLDVACGSGFFSEAFRKAGAQVYASDISPELIEIAKKNSKSGVSYRVAPADHLKFSIEEEYDFVTLVMAIQNIKNIEGVISECSRVLKPRGRMVIIMNHPAFRIPKRSSWEYDAEKKIQYRRMDGYMSEASEEMEMNPGSRNKISTMSFHRPLQVFFKLFNKYGLAAVRLEEWISEKESQKGSRKQAEDISRKEFPLFLALVLEKMS